MRLLKLLVVLILAAVIALAAYAYFGDMAPRQNEVRNPIAISVGSGTAPAANNAANTAEVPAAPQAGTDANANADATTETGGD